MTENMPQKHQAIIQALSYPGDTLPEDALRDAITYYADIKPALHAALQLSPDEIIGLEHANGDEYSLQFFALYLVAEKRDTDAFPLIRDFFAHYGKAANELAGDMVGEHLGQILASVCQDAKALKAAIELPGLNIWPRSAFISALGVLYHQGHLERAQLLDWFQTWFEPEGMDIDGRTSIAFSCCDLALHEFEPTLLEALKSSRIDPGSMDAEGIKDDMRREHLKAHQESYYELVDDAIALLRTWYWDDDSDTAADFYAALYEPEEMMVITSLLNDYNDDDELLTLECFHGYVQAVVLTPEPLSANEWIPEVFGGVMPAFDSIDQANKIFFSLMQFYNRLNQQRLEHMLYCPFRLEDRHLDWWFNSVREWCRGFMQGMHLRWDYWMLPETDPQAEQVNAAMLVVLAIADETAVSDLFDIQDDDERSKQAREFLALAIPSLPNSIRTLTDFSQSQDAVRLSNLPLRSTKVGRNAPCPCGSDKKFKKCCGAAGRSVH